MSTDPERQALYDQLRERFINDPEFRAELRANPTTTLEGVLGELTDDERRWISEISANPSTDEELVDLIKSGKVGAW